MLGIIYSHVGGGEGGGGSILPVGKVATEKACGYLRHIAILLIKE